VRQYYIFYKREGGKFAKLDPTAHANLYDKPEVAQAIDALRGNLAFEAVAVRVGNELFNVVAFTQEAEAPQAFKF
jgi:hypothetical protein